MDKDGDKLSEKTFMPILMTTKYVSGQPQVCIVNFMLNI